MESNAKKFICCLLSIGLFGCKTTTPRPDNVPASAAKVDNVFIDCSVEKTFRANQCSVYKGDTGEILADGLFVLRSGEPVSETELRYKAFNETGIFLEDSSILYQQTASGRDPSHRVFNSRLRTIASEGRAVALDCGQMNIARDPDTLTECILSSAAHKKPFFASYYWSSIAHFGYEGLAGDSTGTVYGAFYSSGDALWTGRTGKHGQILDGGHTMVVPCPKPTTLLRNKMGTLTCFTEILEAHPEKPTS
jgi:hypothetical protein